MSTQPRTVTTRRPHVQINVNAPPEAGTQHGQYGQASVLRAVYNGSVRLSNALSGTCVIHGTGNSQPTMSLYDSSSVKMQTKAP